MVGRPWPRDGLRVPSPECLDNPDYSPDLSLMIWTSRFRGRLQSSNPPARVPRRRLAAHEAGRVGN